MHCEVKNKWRKFCEHAAVARDPEKLRELAQEINRMLEEEEQQHTQAQKTKTRARCDLDKGTVPVSD